MIVTELFKSSRYSIAHAKRRIDEFERELVDFIATEPHAIVSEPNAEGTFKSVKLKLMRDLPEPMAGIAFDAVSNLRAALDQACYTVAVASGKSGNRAHFPFGNDKADASSTIGRKSRDIPQEVHLSIIEFLKPYKGGNDTLWALNELCNTYKHNIVVPTIMAVGHAVVRGKAYPGIAPVKWPPVWDSAKNEVEISRVPLDSTDEPDVHASLEVTMSEIEGIAGKRAVEVLQAMGNSAFHCVQKIEQFARRFGFVA